MISRAFIVACACLLCLAAPARPQTTAPVPAAALLDSLRAWHLAERAAAVDSAAAPAIVRARASRDDALLRALLLARGRTRAAFGHARAAEPDLREALALAAAARDTTTRLEALRWLSVAVGTQGRTAEARRLYGELARLAVAAADSQQLAWAWMGQAYDHYQAGRADSAIAVYGAAADVLDRAGVAKGAIWAWNGQGLALRQAGRLREGAASFRRALARARASHDALNTAVALNHLGRLEMFVGDPGRAVVMLHEARAIHARHGHFREEALAAIDIATALALQGRLDAAAAGLDSALATCRAERLRDLEILALCQLADVRLAQGRPAAAAVLCRRALATNDAPSAMARTEPRLRLARSLGQRDSLDAALAVLEAAVAQGTGATSLALRVAAERGRLLLAAGRPATALATLLPAEAAARAAGAGELRVALLTCAGRARLALGQPDSALAAFRAAATAWEAVRELPADPAWRELRSLAAGELFPHATAALLDHPAADPPSRRVETAFAFAQRYKARTLFERLHGPGEKLPAAPGAVALAQLRERTLRPGEVLLEAVQGEDVGVLFCATTETVLAARVAGARACRPPLQRLADAVASADVQDALPALGAAAAVANAWPEEIRAILRGARRVLWCPDGALHHLPLALLAGDGAPGLLPPGCAIARLPAAGLLADGRLRGRTLRPPARVLAVAGLDSGATRALPGAAAETRWLAAMLHAVARVDGVADGPPGTEAWRQADVVHLAAHVRADAQQPWNTAVLLGAGARGELRAGEVAALPLQATLAVLSGCRTAGDRVVGGEGLLGLAAGFAAAGTPAVLATLWPVDDHAAARFAARFYRALAAGADAGDALAQAREACRADPATAASRHWAGFVLVGDPGVVVPVRERARAWPAAVALLVVAAAAIWAARRG